jgi:hypothetical protein
MRIKLPKDNKVTNLQIERDEKARKTKRANLRPDEYICAKDLCWLFPEHFKYRTVCEWRTVYNESKQQFPNNPEDWDRNGPQFIYIGGKVRYKVQWIYDSLNGLDWELVRRNRAQSISS